MPTIVSDETVHNTMATHFGNAKLAGPPKKLENCLLPFTTLPTQRFLNTLANFHQQGVNPFPC